MCEGYYSIVNGYKNPFIDQDASKAAGDDRYLSGTTFDDIYGLFSFDRDLRELTFRYLLKAEALIKTICAYTFAEAHQGSGDAYLDRNNFATAEEYNQIGLKNYEQNLGRLHKELTRAVRMPRNEAVKHYVNNHCSVPIWVLTKTLTFGTVEHLFNLMKRDDQNVVCKRVVKVLTTDKYRPEHLAPITARRAIDVLVKYRNICAHDERLYCAKVGHRKKVDYFGCVKQASLFLSIEDFLAFNTKIIDLVTKYARQRNVLSHIIQSTGFEEFTNSELPRIKKLVMSDGDTETESRHEEDVDYHLKDKRPAAGSEL